MWGSRESGKRRYAGLLAAVMAVSCVPVYAAEPVSDGVVPTCDEAYYATLDYYGNLTQGSVVKSYTLNGAKELTDYGTYDQVVNLTDATAPVTRDGATTFSFGDSAPAHFYFEGVTSQPFETLPWNIAVHYTLNGVATKAEDLAGKAGEVEIQMDFVPNPAASDYAKNNDTLEAMALFNQDDILSLEAEGAQVQLIGNLRLVLFLAMPGEEQHFTIRVGTDDFSFDGLTFLMVPATLSQLSQITELSQKKDDLEKNYDKLSSSLDTLLDSMNGMSGSLYATAEGLDELNDARGTLSAGKDDLYAGADAVLGDLGSLNDALDTLPAHLDTASNAVDSVSKSLKNVTTVTEDLLDELEDTKAYLNQLRTDLNKIRNLTGTTYSTGELQTHLEQLGTHAAALKANLAQVRPLLAQLQLGIGTTTNSDGTKSTAQQVTVQGMTVAEVNAALEQAKQLSELYAAAAGQGPMTLEQFVTAVFLYQKVPAAQAQTQAQALLGLKTTVDGQISAKAVELAGGAVPTKEQVAQATQAVLGALAQSSPENYQNVLQANLLAAIYQAAAGSSSGLNSAAFLTAMLMLSDYQTKTAGITDSATLQTILGKVTAAQATYAAQAANLLTLYSQSQTGLLATMSSLCDTLGSNGLSGDLASLSGLAGDTLRDLDTLLAQSDDLLDDADSILTEVKNVETTVDKYTPDLKQTLTDTKTVLSATHSTISDTRGFLSTFESLMKKADSKLDSGTKKTLTGLAATLRQAAASLSTTGDVKSAKNNISDIIEDTWNEYTGQVSNLLNMDANAETVSLTSAENAAPQSIQILMRTQEIKTSDAETPETQEKTVETGTFWSRVADLFHNMWHTLTGVFQH